MMEYGLGDTAPDVHEDAFLFPSADIIGDVEIGADSSVWPSASVRGDSNQVRIGEGTSIQDGCVVHTTADDPAIIGDRVTVGHGAIVHGCTVDDEVLIGMGARVLSGATVGEHSIIAAGAVVPEGMAIPSNSVVMGVPGEVVRETTADDIERIHENAQIYLEKVDRYRDGLDEV